MLVRANFVDIYFQGMRDRSMRSGTELAWEIQLTDWSTAGNLSNWSSGVQIPRDICTRFGRYLYSARCSWKIISDILGGVCHILNFIESGLFHVFEAIIRHAQLKSRNKLHFPCVYLLTIYPLQV